MRAGPAASLGRVALSAAEPFLAFTRPLRKGQRTEQVMRMLPASVLEKQKGQESREEAAEVLEALP